MDHSEKKTRSTSIKHASAVSKVSSSIIVTCPREAVFRLTQDYYLRKEWDPFVREIRFLDGATEPAVGVGVWVRAWNGLTMTVEYVSYRFPSVAAIKMTKGPLFFETFGGVWRFAEVDSNSTEVTFEYGFRTRWPVLTRVLNPTIWWVFGRDIRARLAAIKRAAEETDIVARLDVGCA
ncbi:MAG: SRPBCC family protein [Chloroflexota bacterium]